MKIKRRNPLHRRAQKGFRGYPVATIAFYGPNDRVATKVAVGIVTYEDAEAEPLERWFSDRDVRRDPEIGEEIRAFIEKHKAKTVAMADRIIGCPHEEGIDYPAGEVCPVCPFWAHRDRFTGELLPEQ